MTFFRLTSILLFALNYVAATQDKLAKYQSLSKYHLPTQLNDSSYAEVVAKPRDYHAAILLTASDSRYGCQICRDLQPEWDLLAKSWNKGASHESTKLLFGTLDFDDGKGVFQQLMLQTAPVLLFFPPTVGPAAKLEGLPLRYEFTGPIPAEQLYAWLSRQLPGSPKLDIIRPTNYTRIVGVTTLILFVVAIFGVASPYLLPIIRSRSVWAVGCLISLLLFTSGHMFNHIRSVPYVSGDARGGINYFASGFSNQFGLESQILAAIYGLLSFGTITLAIKLPQLTDPKSQQVTVIIWALILLGAYSFLMSIFRIKSGGYPFFLPPF